MKSDCGKVPKSNGWGEGTKESGTFAIDPQTGKLYKIGDIGRVYETVFKADDNTEKQVIKAGHEIGKMKSRGMDKDTIHNQMNPEVLSIINAKKDRNMRDMKKQVHTQVMRELNQRRM